MTSVIEIEKKSDEQKGSESDVAGFRDSLGPFVIAAEHTRMAMVFTRSGPNNPIIFANDAFLKLTHYSREEILGASLNDLMEEGTGPEIYSQVMDAFESPEPKAACPAFVATSGIELIYQRKDGSSFSAALQVSPVRDSSGAIIQHVASLIDLTEHKAEQKHAKMMLDELNHRVKNTLATVQGIVAQALRKATSTEDIRKSIEGRLFALSRSHDLLSAVKWKGSGLSEIVEIAMEPFHDGGHRYTMTGENIMMSPKTTLALGMAIHELATNALKYGALSNHTGTIAISWKTMGERVLISWQEAEGPLVVAPSRKGFGSQVLTRGLAYELLGTVELNFDPKGVSCLIDIPLPHQQVTP